MSASLLRINSSDHCLVGAGNSRTERKRDDEYRPAGRQVTYAGIDIEKVVNGTIVEMWLNFDALGLLQQLGTCRAQAERARTRLGTKIPTEELQPYKVN